jgi:hypothetical protein
MLMKKLVSYFFLVLFAALFFSYKLIQIPRGLTIDEAAFGYNAILLSETLHDENNRFMPIFVLSINGKDWRQPVMQYSLAGFFKIFGPSIFNLRFVSVIATAISVLLIFLLTKQLLGNFGAVLSVLFFVTTPIIMIHSHLGLDNIMSIPFTLGWLVFLYLYEKKHSLKYLIFSAFFLGIGFYSYKGMRSFVPVWSILTAIFISLPFIKSPSKKNLFKIFKPASAFILTIIPFYAIIPFLETKYAGAVLGQANIKIESVYKFLHSYLASFDPSFLFITGDTMPHHSTGIHGMLLLASLPFFLVGLNQTTKNGKYWTFLTASFFLGPIFFGFPGSIHRASRLIALVPIYCLICALGGQFLWQNKKAFKIAFVCLVAILAINSYDFLHYYWLSYADDTYHIFYSTKADNAYKTLKAESKKRNLTPYVSYEIIRKEELSDQGITNTFLRSIYFPHYPGIWNENKKDFPKNAILMSNQDKIPNLEKLTISTANYYFYTAAQK